MNRALALALVTSLSLGAVLPEASTRAEQARREGALCQLSLSGSVQAGSINWVSISVTHLVEDEAVETSLAAQLRTGTHAGSLSALLAARLMADGAMVTSVNHTPHLMGELFVEDVLSVRLDLPSGPQASVTFCDRPLGVLGLRATSAAPGDGKVEFIGVVMSVDGKTRSNEKIEVPVRAGDTGHDVCKRLFNTSIEAGWLSLRPATDRWSPARRKDSRKLESTEVKLSAPGWEIELVAG